MSYHQIGVQIAVATIQQMPVDRRDKRAQGRNRAQHLQQQGLQHSIGTPLDGAQRMILGQRLLLVCDFKPRGLQLAISGCEVLLFFETFAARYAAFDLPARSNGQGFVARALREGWLSSHRSARCLC